jgi:dihydrolipoamide dehydrogenase
MPALTHDVVIIGGGPAGYTGAIREAQLGLNVGVVEVEPQLGGTCLRVGCIPSKALLESSARFAEAQHHLAAHGVVVGDLKLDLGTMMGRKTEVVKTLAGGIEGLFKKHKVTRYKGTSSLGGRGADTGQQGGSPQGR